MGRKKQTEGQDSSQHTPSKAVPAPLPPQAELEDDDELLDEELDAFDAEAALEPVSFCASNALAYRDEARVHWRDPIFRARRSRLKAPHLLI